MMKIHKNIFYNICDKNVDLYMEIIKNIRDEYKEAITNIKIETNVSIIRYNVHKLLGLICYLGNTEEIFYICKMMLQNNKTETDYKKYEYWIQKLYDISIESIFGSDI